MMAPSSGNAPTWTLFHLVIFILTFLCYAAFHATRKTYSNVKPTLSAEWTPSFHNASVSALRPDQTWNSHCMFEDDKTAEYYLGVLDTTFLICYAVGLYISGALGDRFDLRLVLSFGMCSSAVMVFIFGTLTEWLGFYNIYFYVIVWGLNGLLQSSGWPAVVAIMGNWFGKSSRGFVFGLWSACASVGNIFGAFMVAGTLQHGYEYCFLFSSSVLFAGGVVVFFGLVPRPEMLGLPDPDSNSEEDSRRDQDAEPLLEGSDQEDGDHPKEVEQAEAISFLQALRLPGVALYSLSYACLKLVNYSFFFWLPYYLTNKFGWSNSSADEISIWYDVGGIIAGIISGYISDRMNKRAPVVVVMLVFAFPALYVYSIGLYFDVNTLFDNIYTMINYSPDSKMWNSILMAIVGFFIGGPANLISSAISADLGRQEAIRGSKEALATVTGIIDGTGSVGAAIGQILVPVIQVNLDWHWVFYFFLLMTFLTIQCIMPILWKEIKEMSCWQSIRRRFRRQPRYSIQEDLQT